MNDQSVLSEVQLEQCQRLRALNYAMHKAGLPPIFQADHLRQVLDITLFSSDHKLNPMRLCAHCDEFLQDGDPSSDSSLIMHNTPECMKLFHEKCFMDFQRTYSACPACKPEYDLAQLRRANEALMDDIANAADIDAQINLFFLHMTNVYEIANDADKTIVREAYCTFEEQLLLDEEASSTPIPADEPEEKDEAVKAYRKRFPRGYDIIPTSSEDYLCAFRAICSSLQALADQDSSIPVPTLEALQEVTQQWEWRSLMGEFGVDGDLMNENYFRVDQAALAAQMWAEKHSFAIRLGCIFPAGFKLPIDKFFLLPYAPLSTKRLRNADDPLIYFIHSDNVEEEDVNAINHFEGVRARIRPRGAS